MKIKKTKEKLLHIKIYIFTDFATYVPIPISLSKGFKLNKEKHDAIKRFKPKKNKGI